MKNKIDFQNHFSERKSSKFNNGILSEECVCVCVCVCIQYITLYINSTSPHGKVEFGILEMEWGKVYSLFGVNSKLAHS